MGRAIEIGQSLNLLSVLANNTDWSSLDSDAIQRVINQPRLAGEQFTAFLRSGGRMSAGDQTLLRVLKGKFKLSEFLHEDQDIVDEENDPRCHEVSILDIHQIRLDDMRREGDRIYVDGMERFRRAKTSGYTRLNGDAFLALWNVRHVLPDSWKEKVRGTPKQILFDGTVIAGLHGRWYVQGMAWHYNEWHAAPVALMHDAPENFVSVVLT